MENSELIAWAINEIRELDELCRSMVPGYQSLESDDILKLRRLVEIQEEMAEIEESIADLEDI